MCEAGLSARLPCTRRQRTSLVPTRTAACAHTRTAARAHARTHAPARTRTGGPSACTAEGCMHTQDTRRKGGAWWQRNAKAARTGGGAARGRCVYQAPLQRRHPRRHVQRGNVSSQGLSCRQRLSLAHHPVHEAHCQRLLGRHRSPRHCVGQTRAPSNGTRASHTAAQVWREGCHPSSRHGCTGCTRAHTRTCSGGGTARPAHVLQTQFKLPKPRRTTGTYE
jgi:hypothetical protein